MMQLPPILSALCWCGRNSNLYLLYDKNWNLRVLRWRDFQNSFGSNFPPHPGTFQILHSRSAFCVKFPTPWVRTTVKYPKVAGEGRGDVAASSWTAHFTNAEHSQGFVQLSQVLPTPRGLLYKETCFQMASKPTYPSIGARKGFKLFYVVPRKISKALVSLSCQCV